MTDDDYDALSQKQLASIKRDMRISLEDAAVRATHKVMAELETEPNLAELEKIMLEVWQPVQPEQCQCPNCKVTLHASDCAVHSGPAYPAGGCDCGAQQEQEPANGVQYAQGIPFFIPPVHRSWVGLTQEEVEDSYNTDYKAQTRAIEAKLKEKNT